jgi:hypothetical protein
MTQDSILDPVTQQLISNSQRIKVLEAQLASLTSLFISMKRQFGSKKVVKNTVTKSSGKSTGRKRQSQPVSGRQQSLPQQQQDQDQDAFYSAVSKGLKLSRDDNVATIVTKLISFTESSRKQNVELYEEEKKFNDESYEKEKDFRTKFLEAIKTLKVKRKVKPEKKEPQPRDEKGRFIKKESAQEVAKTAEKEVVKDTVKETEKQVAKQTAEKVETLEPAPSVKSIPEVKPPAPPSVSPALEAVKQALPTAAKVAVGVGAATALGSVSAKQESGKGGVETISDGMQGRDPGGVSYGKYQLASNTGTMQAFLASPEGKKFADDFKGLKPGTPEFSAVYRNIAKNKREEFEKAQQDFIERTHYKPVETYAKMVGLNVDDRGVKEALFSQSVQHGLAGNKKIIDAAKLKLGDERDPAKEIQALYESRANYVSSLHLKDEKGILGRYKREVVDALTFVGKNDTGSKLNDVSNNNKDLKGVRAGTNVVVDNTTTTVNTTNRKEEIVIMPPTTDIKPIHME